MVQYYYKDVRENMMPEETTIKAICAACGESFHVPLRTHVDAAKQPSYKRALREGRFFSHICPQCLQPVTAIHRLFYQDASHMLQLLLEPTETRQEVFYPEAVPAFHSGYRLRLVSAPEALAEALRIAEDGLSDKVLEVWKHTHMERLTREYAGRRIEVLRYARGEGKYISFDLIANGRSITRLSLPRADYDARERALAPYLRKGELPGRYLRVDAGYLKTKAGKQLLQRWEEG